MSRRPVWRVLRAIVGLALLALLILPARLRTIRLGRQ